MSTIVQCKHFSASGFGKLRSNLAKEKLKVAKLSPSGYILFTSVGLTPQNKDEIKGLLSPYLKRTEDIFGHSDILNLLGRHPRVAVSHFKLWLASADVLSRLISNASFVRTEALKVELAQQVRVYVSNDSFRRAIDILTSKHVCVISGLPGIGKTLLARMLLLHHLNQKYEAVAVSSDIEEANQLFRDDTHQFFYYDDFLGTSFHEGMQKNEDSRLIEFMSLVSHHPNKRLVLTTREYILRNAFSKYERLVYAMRDSLKCVIDLGDYTKLLRGRILYNHLYFSGLSPKQKTSLCGEKRYFKIIDHPNFSPRLIEYAIEIASQRGVDSTKIPEFFLTSLDNPQRLWEHAFNNQLSSESQAVLIAMAFLPRLAAFDDVGEIASSICARRAGREIPRVTFLKETRLMDGTFVAIHGEDPECVRLSYHNPAIRDYLLHLADEDSSIVTLIVENAKFFEPLVSLWNAAESIDYKAPDHPQNKFPRLLQWLRDYQDLYSSAMKRTIAAESCVWEEQYVWRERVTLVVQRAQESVESRLVSILEIAEHLADNQLREWAFEMVDNLSVKWLMREGDKGNAVKLLLRPNLPEHVLRFVKGWALEDLTEATSFEPAISLVEDCPDLVEDEFRKSLEEAFYTFVDRKYEYLMNEADDPRSIQSSVEDVNVLADKLGLQPTWDSHEIDQRIGALQHEQDDFDEAKAVVAHNSPAPLSGPLAESVDHQVELLFDSLRIEDEVESLE